MITHSPWRKRRRALVAILLMTVIALGLIASGPVTRAFAADDGWRPIGPSGGAVGTILVHPANPDRIFIESADGLFRSDDGGEHWRTLYVRRDWRTAILAVTLHPTDPDTLYAFFVRRDFPRIIDLFVSHDGGETWQLQFSPSRVDEYSDVVTPTLAIAPSEPNTLYLFIDRSLYKSEDGGSSWTQLNVSGQVIGSLIVSPADANVVYATAVGSVSLMSRLLKSEDAGAHWVSLDIPGDWGYDSLTGHPTDPDTLFISHTDGLYVTRDGGRSWSKTGLDLWLPLDVSISPTEPAIMYAAANGLLFKSKDGGTNWRVLEVPLSSQSASWVAHVTVHPTDSETVFINGPRVTLSPPSLDSRPFGGVYKSEDGGGHWRLLNHDMPNSAIKDFAFSPTTGALYAVGGLGAFRRDPGGSSWIPINDGLGEGPPVAQYIAISPGDPGTLYLVSQQIDEETAAIYVSQDQGEHWRKAGKPAGVGLPRALIVAPTSPPALYLIDGLGEIEKSRDGGITWTKLTSSPLNTWEIAFDPTDPNRLYAISSASSRQSLWRSTNGGGQWTEVPIPRTPTEGYGTLEPLAVDPTGGVYIHQGASGSLLRSDDQGASWEKVDALPLHSYLYDITFDPANPAHMAIAANNGVIVSWDRGRSWTRAGQPLSALHPVRQIAMDPMNTQRLVAMNQWDGLYERAFIVQKTLLPLVSAADAGGGGGQIDPTTSGAWVQPARLDPEGRPQTIVQPQQLVIGLASVQYWRGMDEETDPNELRVAVFLTVGDQAIDCLQFPSNNSGAPRVLPFPGQQEEYAFSFVAPKAAGRYNLTASIITGKRNSDASSICPKTDNWQSTLPPNAIRVIGEVVVQE